MIAIVNGLEEKYAGSVKVEIKNAHDPDSQKQIKKYGFTTHGLVIFDGQGNLKKKMNGHSMRKAEIQNALLEVLKGQ